jgi:hypothetical protein
MILLQTAPKKQTLPQIRQQRSLVRGINLRTSAKVLPPTSFQARKAYMVSAYQEGKFLADPESRGKPRPNPMSDPAAMEGMMGMMKGNMAMMVPQTLIMGWINAFFSGFVISEYPMFNLHRQRVAYRHSRNAAGSCDTSRSGNTMESCDPGELDLWL